LRRKPQLIKILKFKPGEDFITLDVKNLNFLKERFSKIFETPTAYFGLHEISTKYEVASTTCGGEIGNTRHHNVMRWKKSLPTMTKFYPFPTFLSDIRFVIAGEPSTYFKAVSKRLQSNQCFNSTPVAPSSANCVANECLNQCG